MTAVGLRFDHSGVTRCAWCGDDALYHRYHDEEWARPVSDDRRLFEKLCLEGFQAGLSWLTILRKRESFRRAFSNFDIELVARFGEEDVRRLVQDASIIRHRGKIEAAIHNARRTLDLIETEGSLARFIWSFEPPPSERPRTASAEAIAQLTQTPTSRRLASELKRRGFRFVGPTTAYAFMQAMGLVNDHLVGCHVRAEIEALRFARPHREPRTRHEGPS